VYPADEAELTRLRDDFRDGRATIRIEEEVFDLAAYHAFLDREADSIAASLRPVIGCLSLSLPDDLQRKMTPPSRTPRARRASEDGGGRQHSRSTGVISRARLVAPGRHQHHRVDVACRRVLQIVEVPSCMLMV
jgi:hypothetical protein